MAFPPDGRDLIGNSKMEAVGRAHCHTGRLQTLINPFLTEVALDHFAHLFVPLGCPPRACGHAGLAAHANGMIHKNNAVFLPFLHGPRGTCRHTPWIFAVKTGHEGIGSPGQVADKGRPYRNNFTEPGTHRQILVAFADHFTAPATDTFFYVLKQVVLAHLFPPNSAIFTQETGSILTKVPCKAGLPPILSEILAINRLSFTPF